MHHYSPVPVQLTKLQHQKTNGKVTTRWNKTITFTVENTAIITSTTTTSTSTRKPNKPMCCKLTYLMTSELICIRLYNRENKHERVRLDEMNDSVCMCVRV